VTDERTDSRVAATTKAEAWPTSEPVLEIRDLTKQFPLARKLFKRSGKRVVHAVEHVDLKLFAGQVTAIIGESGSGKSTIARVIGQLYKPTSGEIRLYGEVVHASRSKSFRAYVGKVQLMLQDPFGSFNPVHTIGYHLTRALRIHNSRLSGSEIESRMAGVLKEVNLAPARQFAEKFPHELSGGQLQRISIARALAAEPAVLLADEPVSSLDVSIRLGILNLLQKLAVERGVALLYITHDIASARYFATTANVMYAGELIEGGPAEDVTQNAAHPYTQLLIAAAPDPDRDETVERVKDIGQPPSLIDPPTGCRFHPRCPFAMEKCLTQSPPKFDVGNDHWARCWLHEDKPELTGIDAGHGETRLPDTHKQGPAISLDPKGSAS
jgi:peptide/nickel transport system ATP-binding protein